MKELNDSIMLDWIIKEGEDPFDTFGERYIFSGWNNPSTPLEFKEKIKAIFKEEDLKALMKYPHNGSLNFFLKNVHSDIHDK